MKRWRVIGICVVAVLSLFRPSLADADWRDDLRIRLEARYKRAKLSFLNDNIRERGDVFLLMQAGVLADRNSFATNDVRNGELQRQSRSNKFGALLREAQDREALQYQVVLGLYQPVYVTAVFVSDDRITLQVATTAQHLLETVDRAAIARFADGTSIKGDRLSKVDVSIRKAALVFQFPRGTLSAQPVDDVLMVVDKMLVAPDHPDAPQFGTVSIGLTREQVIRNMGKPKNIVKLEDREILVFDSIKVTLREGKVVDVQ